MAIEIERIGDTKDDLGEGLLWDPQGGLLYWIDAMVGKVHRCAQNGGKLETITIGEPIGALLRRCDGRILATLADSLAELDFDRAATSPFCDIPMPTSGMRLNDAVIDRQHRAILGGMHIRPAEPYQSRLYRVDGRGNVEIIESGIGVTNGPCFSPSGETFYCADSARRIILAYNYDVERGRLSNKRVHFDASQMGVPDGAAIDENGDLWCTMLGAGKLCRIDPAGRLQETVELPVLYPTNVTFGGSKLDILYMTTLSKGPNYASDQRGSGGLFAISGLSVRGFPELEFKG